MRLRHEELDEEMSNWQQKKDLQVLGTHLYPYQP